MPKGSGDERKLQEGLTKCGGSQNGEPQVGAERRRWRRLATRLLTGVEEEGELGAELVAWFIVERYRGGRDGTRRRRQLRRRAAWVRQAERHR
jgi:hypothetical protein